MLDITKAERLAKTKGAKGWISLLCLLAIMCADQFLLDIPYENVVFPILVICAASMSGVKNLVLIAAYSLIFELSCIAWNPADIVRVQWWLCEVFIGYLMPFAVYKTLNREHKNISVVSYAALAAAGELLYFWVSVAATSLIWHVPFFAYLTSDLPFEAVGCAVTFVCALPIAAIYKLITGELKIKKRLSVTDDKKA